jgi:hypothetical protein
MIIPKNKIQLIDLLSKKSFKIEQISEGKAVEIAEKIKKIGNKTVAVIVIT